MRETPQNIDRSVKALEYFMAFLIPSILTFPILELWAILFGFAVCVVTIKFTAGKSPGFMQEWLYARGVTLAGLLPRSVKRLDQ